MTHKGTSIDARQTRLTTLNLIVLNRVRLAIVGANTACFGAFKEQEATTLLDRFRQQWAPVPNTAAHSANERHESDHAAL